MIIDTPARQALTYQMVGRKQLANAIALNTSLFNIGRVGGPAIAGVGVYFVVASPSGKSAAAQRPGLKLPPPKNVGRKVGSRVVSALNRQKLVRGYPAMLLKAPPNKRLPSGCSARTRTMPLGLGRKESGEARLTVTCATALVRRPKALLTTAL